MSCAYIRVLLQILKVDHCSETCYSPPNSLSEEYLQAPYYGLRQFLNECLRQHELHPWECQWERVGVRLVRNSRAIINQLPNELFLDILHLVRDVDVDGWMKTVRVCRRWYYLATTTPTLWTRPIVQGNLNFLRTCLERSTTLPFKLRINDGSAVDAVLDDLAPAMHRLQSLSLRDIGNSAELALALLALTGGLPALHKLKVAYPQGRRFSQEFQIEFSPTWLPSLEILSLSAVSIPLSSPPPRLRKLHILNKASRSRNFTSSAFASFLRSMPQLEELVVRRAAFYDSEWRGPTSGDGPDPARIPKVMLPRLETVILSGISHFAHRTLQFLDVPPHAEVQLEHDPPILDRFSQRGAYTGLRAFIPTDTSTLRVLSEASKVDVALLEDEHLLFGTQSGTPTRALSTGSGHHVPSSSQAPAGAGTILLSAFLTVPDFVYTSEQVSAMPTGLADLVAVFGRSPVEELSIDIAANKVSTVDWRATLAAFPTLRSLRVVLVPPLPKQVTEYVYDVHAQ